VSVQPPDALLRRYITSNGDMMVNIADVIDWLRQVELAVVKCRPCSPSEVVSDIADDLRNAWIDGTSRLVKP
jgi:hypothetical protein